MCGHDLPLEPFDRAWDSDTAPDLAPRRRAMLADTLTYLPGSVLTKVDRAAMAVSLETRAPLLDHRLLELALRLPLPAVTGKRILKRIAYEHVPRVLIDRPKMGFEVPLDQWLRGPLGHRLADLLEARALDAAGISDLGPARAMLAAHRAGVRDRGRQLWTMLVLAQWLEAHAGSRSRHPC
jgi:asparagine synthase (glutamine-hydrolysing)